MDHSDSVDHPTFHAKPWGTSPEQLLALSSLAYLIKKREVVSKGCDLIDPTLYCQGAHIQPLENAFWARRLQLIAAT